MGVKMERVRLLQVIRTMGLGLSITDLLTKEFENKIIRNFRRLSRTVGLTDVEGVKLILDIFESGDWEKEIKKEFKIIDIEEVAGTQEINMKMIKKDVQQLGREVRANHNLEPLQLRVWCSKKLMSNNTFQIITGYVTKKKQLNKINYENIVVEEFSKYGKLVKIDNLNGVGERRYTFEVRG